MSGGGEYPTLSEGTDVTLKPLTPTIDPAAPASSRGTTNPAMRASKRGIWGWMLFDVATQPFSTLVLTFVFAPYFTSLALTNESADAFLSSIGLGWTFDPSEANADEGPQAVWGYIVGAVGLLTAFIAPVLGAVADASGPRKPWIAFFAVLAILGSLGLWVVPPEASLDLVWWSVLAFAVAFFGFEFATVFNNAMMPTLVPRAELGRLSGNAWALGYVGGLVTLVIVLAFMSANPETGRTLFGFEPIFGLDAAQAEGDRAVGPFTAIWFAVFVLPLFVFTPDAPRAARESGAVRRGLRQLRQTLRTLPQQRSLFAYLGSSMLYRDALNGLYTFGGVYAAGVLGWSIILVGVFGIIAALIGAIGAWLGGKLDAARGPKFVVALSIIALIIVTFTVATTDRTGVLFMEVGGALPDLSVTLPLLGTLQTPDLAYFLCGTVIGAAGGALQAASRTLLVDQADPARMTEAFGLYALSGKATSFLAPVLVALVTSLSASQSIGVLPLVALFALGLALLPFVKGRPV